MTNGERHGGKDEKGVPLLKDTPEFAEAVEALCLELSRDLGCYVPSSAGEAAVASFARVLEAHCWTISRNACDTRS